MQTDSPLHAYISSQLSAGLTNQDIVTQLRQAGWDDDSIRSGFNSVAQSLAAAPEPAAPPADSQPEMAQPAAYQAIQPEHPEQPASPTGFQEPQPVAEQPQTLPEPLHRGRLKVGWLLFKQSLTILKQSPGLTAYVVAAIVATFVVEIVFVTILLVDIYSTRVINSNPVTQAAFVLVFMFLLTGMTYFFTTALSAHVLTTFKGQPTSFKENLAIARSKLGAITVYALITTTVGFVLRMIEERFRFIGFIIAKLLGALWTLATSFSLPVIADTDKNGVQAIKESLQLFKQTWGESIVSRVAVGGLAFLLFFVVMLPVCFLIAYALFPLMGPLSLIVGLGLFVITAVVLSIFVTLATSIINVSLYYYAKYHAIPPTFDPALLASVFVAKKNKR